MYWTSRGKHAQWKVIFKRDIRTTNLTASLSQKVSRNTSVTWNLRVCEESKRPLMKQRWLPLHICISYGNGESIKGFTWELHPIVPKDKRLSHCSLLLLCVFPVEQTVGNIRRICFQKPYEDSCDYFRKKSTSWYFFTEKIMPF